MKNSKTLKRKIYEKRFIENIDIDNEQNIKFISDLHKSLENLVSLNQK